MKFLHTSDWHLGMMFRGGVSYAQDQKYAIEQICKIASEEKVDGILLAGDVFDKSIAVREALQLYDASMTHICAELGIPVCLIAGNHDGAERLASCNALLKKSGLYIAGILEKEPQVVRLGDAEIFLLPWISTDRVRAVWPEQAENIQTMEDAFRLVLDQYRAVFTEGCRHILVAHAFVGNAETSVSDRAAEVGRATMVSAGMFDGFDYVALGHLHGPQQIRPSIRYSGTPMAYAFGKEEKQQKSVTILDTDTLDLKIVPLPQLHRRTTLTGTFDELMAADVAEEVRDGYVRLEVTDQFVSMASIAALREVYKNLLEVTGKSLEPDGTRITMTIEEFENADTDPESVFMHYCEDMIGEMPAEHLLQLFRRAKAQYEKEVGCE